MQLTSAPDGLRSTSSEPTPSTEWVIDLRDPDAVDDALDAARGVVVAAVASIPLWAAASLGAWYRWHLKH